MKVFIVYVIPDYIGIQILKVFSNKDSALNFKDFYNKNDEFASKYDSCKAEWYEEEVFDNFERSIVDG